MAVFLFNWGYGQICISTDIQKIAFEDTYTGINANINSLTPGGTGNDAALSSNIQNIHDNNLDTFFSLESSLPKNSGSTINPNYEPGTLNANFSVNNLDIKNGEIVYLKVGEADRFGGTLGATAATITYTITAFKGNTSFIINPINSLTSISSTRTGTLSFTAPDDIDKITVAVNASKPFSGTSINILPQSRLQIQFYGIYVNPLCQPTPCNTTIPITKEFYGESLTSGGTILLPHENLINSDTSDGVTFVAIGNTWVKKATPFKQNSYVGFNIDEGSLLSLATQFTITTSLNNVDVETRTFTNAGISLISGGSRLVGFKTEQLFDQVRINILAFSVGGVTVKNAFIIEPCPDEYVVECNVNTPLVQSEFPAIVVNERSGNTALATAGNIFSNPANIIDNDLDNYATIFAAAGAASTSSIAVKSVGQKFPGGYFAGFLVENSSLVNLDLLSNIRIKTYLNGNLVETAQGSALGLNLQLLPGTNKRVIGFNTTEGDAYDFDEVVFETFSTVAVSIGVTNIYHAIIRKNCFGPDLTCNTDTRVSFPDYPVSISSRTGISGVGIVGQINNVDNVLNSDPNSYTSIRITLGAAGSANLAVQTGNQIFDGGTFAGFEVESTSLLDIGLLNDITVRTYLNGEFQESSNSGNLLLDVGALGSTPKAIVGFETTLPFNEVEYSMGITVNIDLLGETRIYNLILKKFCEPTNPLVCNELRTLKEQEFPVSAYTKVSSAANVSLIGDLVQNIGNLLDNDTSNFVTLNPTVSALTELTIGVNKAGLPFRPGTYAEFEVQSANLIDASLLSNFSIRLINKEGDIVETISSNSLLLGVGLFQFGSQETQKIGFKSTVEFSKAELVYNIPISATLGTTRIYRFNVMETCPIELDCNDSDPITTVDRPVIINAINTGTAGLACVGCSINNAENLIDADLSNSTRLIVAAGVGARNAVSVKDLANIYPAGSSVGFATAEGNPLLNLDLLNSIRVTTYLNGQVVESASGVSLINLNALFIQIFPQNNIYGFRTSSKFDEVQISVGSLASAINVIDLSSLVISTQGANDPDLDFECDSDICVKPGNTEGPGVPSITGISTIQKPRSTWPNDIPNGFIALDSKNKGMVISRVANTGAIANPVEGMLVYDNSANCTKLYNGENWKCIQKSCNE